MPSLNGEKYLLSVVDDFSRFIGLFLLHTKDQITSGFLSFKAMIEKQVSTFIKSIQIDGGGEFKPLAVMLEKEGVVYRLTCPHMPTQNGVAESRHRRAVDRGLAMIYKSKVPMVYWPMAFKTAVYLLNRLPTKVLNTV